MDKPYLVFMAGSGSIEDIRELVDPVKQYFRGVCALLHDCDEFSPEAEYLLKVNTELGGGNIIFGSYVGRHNHSRNRILYETGIKQGQFLVSLDTLERIPIDFAKSIEHIIESMRVGNIDIISYFYKPYIIRFREDMVYVGTPHETLLAERPLNRVEFNQYEPDESKVRVNVRPIKRANEPLHFCGHYAKYLLQPNSNQNLLGLEHHGGGAMLPKLEGYREKIVLLLEKNNLGRDTDGLKKLFSESFNDEVRDVVNNHKSFNDFYRYFILGDKTIKDSHENEYWTNLPQF